MAFVAHSDWVSNQAYSKGDKAEVNGVVYEALVDVASTTSPAQDGEKWIVSSVVSIDDMNGLVESVRLQLDITSLPEINDSIPMFIQLTEDSFKMRLRPPIGRTTVTLTMDSDGKVSVPGNLVEVINLRILEASGDQTWPRQHVEIVNGDYEQFREIRAYFEGNLRRIDDYYDSPIYWFDNKSFWISPHYGEGTTVELVYHASVPRLGTKINITNTAGEKLNSAGQTSVEWIAADAANTAENFVQNQKTVLKNWYLSVAPQLLLYGSLLKAKSFVKDEAKIKAWTEMYVAAELELADYISSFEDHQPHSINMGSAYLK